MSAQETEDLVLYHDTCRHQLYRLTCEEFDALWERSRGQCEICGVIETETKRGRLSIDHDQRSIHLVRGLLCDLCNSGVMRRVDEGRPEYMTEATARYVDNAWVKRDDPVPLAVPIRATRAFAARNGGAERLPTIRTMRIGNVWDEAQTVAGNQGDTVPNIVRLALHAYTVDPTATLVALAQIRGGAR